MEPSANGPARLAARVKVIATALPTYLALVSTAVGIIATELVPLLPENVAAQVGGYAATVVAWLAAIIRTISRLTPATPGTYGLLPPGPD